MSHALTTGAVVRPVHRGVRGCDYSEGGAESHVYDSLRLSFEAYSYSRLGVFCLLVLRRLPIYREGKVNRRDRLAVYRSSCPGGILCQRCSL